MRAWAATWPPGPGPGTTPTRKSGRRIEYPGDDDWGFALYDPATETYEPAVLPGGQLFGSAVEAYDAAAVVHAPNTRSNETARRAPIRITARLH